MWTTSTSTKWWCTTTRPYLPRPLLSFMSGSRIEIQIGICPRPVARGSSAEENLSTTSGETWVKSEGTWPARCFPAPRLLQPLKIQGHIRSADIGKISGQIFLDIVTEPRFYTEVIIRIVIEQGHG